MPLNTNCYLLSLLLLSLSHPFALSFCPQQHHVQLKNFNHRSNIGSRNKWSSPPLGVKNSSTDGDTNLGEALDLKSELTAYLKVREDRQADEEAKKEVGKVIGGTKGNYVLDFVSGSPNKAFVIEDAPNVFDYDELTKYGFGTLVEPIMDSGGRLKMYELMNMTPPPMPERLKPRKAREISIDRIEDDEGRYTGLKMGQMIDDETLGRALEESQRKTREGIALRKKLKEQEYVQPFADKRNTGPQMTPEWTPEMLDEEGRKRGRAESWARKERAGELRSDPYEQLRLEGGLRTYCAFAALIVSFSFGRATPMALTSVLGDTNVDTIISVAQIPSLIVVAAAIGSSVVSSAVLAPDKKRNPFVWFVKGFMGGPLAILQLKGLDELQVRGEEN